MKYCSLIFSLLLLSSCSPSEPQRITRPHLKIDTLPFLIENSDLIVKARIVESKQLKELLELEKGFSVLTVVDFLMGDSEEEIIKVYNTAIHNPPSTKTFHNFQAFEEGIFFLIRHDDGYKMTTDQALIDLSRHLGWAIWNRKDGDVLEYHRFSNEDIFRQIRTAIDDSEP